MYQISNQNLDRLLAAIHTLQKQLENLPLILYTQVLNDPKVKEFNMAVAAVELEIKRPQLTFAPEGDNPMPPTTSAPEKSTNENPKVWSNASGKIQCIWQGAHGRCIYELGHFGDHKEEIAAKP